MNLAGTLVIPAWIIVIVFAQASNAACQGLVSLEMLNKINPDAASDTYCEKVESTLGNKGECVTNAEALEPINKAIRKFGVIERGEIVATIAWMLEETQGWKYNINHFPGNPGQGTRTLMLWKYVNMYAQQVQSNAYIKAIGSFSNDPETADDKTKNNVRELVLNDNDSFGAGFWYIATQETDFHNSDTQLRDGNKDDYKVYVDKGIDTLWSDSRGTWWDKVNSALVF
ncbi:hypothetical protein COEREDRAFT_87992 [Coemansia reversa NRRL 1564]|uniref:Lysozyme-like protein n=1 Tax=Coemansia reversa (strain ATCC 12441 / NRRL 1564) TaxID=763665 RepID=A0A2G5B9H6_COERN|nr:hypothetical protein COEREDRAFT_87992 [Coemansia reversa NRRL 1564]|eukprot:PIA15377.1 hypothetical protein COEREDRAFT_87992 [Coemansia reversa NRRL 1564]